MASIMPQLTLKAVTQRCSVKKVFLEISQNSQENTCARVSLLINLQAEVCNFIKKDTLALVFSSEFCKISKNTLYYKTPLVAASVNILLVVYIDYSIFTYKSFLFQFSGVYNSLLSIRNSSMKSWGFYWRNDWVILLFVRNCFPLWNLKYFILCGIPVIELPKIWMKEC